MQGCSMRCGDLEGVFVDYSASLCDLQLPIRPDVYLLYNHTEPAASRD